jgi:hypothetical protein
MIGFKSTLLMAALALAGTAAADTIGQRERNERARIAQGVRSGELTQREAARLSREQARIRAEEHRLRHNDGRLGPRERAKLQHDLERANRNIERQKHDGQTR